MDKEQDQEEREIQFSLRQVDDFEQSPVWKEIVETVKLRVQIGNEELQSKSDLNVILRTQGDLVACAFFLIQPEALRRAIEEQEVDRNKEKGEEPTDE